MALAHATAREHIYELDPIRGLTALGVVAVHAVAFTVILLHSPLAIELQYGVVSLLHFTREIFVSITAFLMVYVYGGRRFPFKRFWRRRGIGVFVPYVLWSTVYTYINNWVDNPHATPLNWLGALVFNILTGNAEFQLYYILLTLEIYLALPWILSWLQRWGQHPWRLLLASGALQMALMIVDFRFFAAPPFSHSAFGVFWDALSNRFLPFYQFYLVIGGLGAMYRAQVQAWVLRNGKLVLLGFLAGVALLLGTLVWEVNVQGEPIDYGAAVFQPAMVFYAFVVAAFAYWRSSVWVRRRQGAQPWGFQFWHLLSDASFGVYLIHPLLLVPALAMAPSLPTALPEPLRVFLVWFVVATGTVILCFVMLYLPLISRLIGHPCQVDWGSVLKARFAPQPAGALGAGNNASSAAASVPSVTISRPQEALPLTPSAKDLSSAEISTT